MANSEFTMANLGWIQQNPYSHKLNLALGDEPFDDIVAELDYFKQEGGQSIVEVTTVGIVRDVEYLAKAASVTGLNIIAGTGYYLDSTLPAEVKSSTVEELSKVNLPFISYIIFIIAPKFSQMSLIEPFKKQLFFTFLARPWSEKLLKVLVIHQ